MQRRDFLRISSGILGITAGGGKLLAAEPTERWNDRNRAEYNGLLFDWLRRDFKGRAEALSRQLKDPFELKYGYMDLSADPKRERLFEKYGKGRMSGKDADAHVKAALEDFERIRVQLAEAETKAQPDWKYDGGNSFVKEGRIYELEVTASRLSVVLDASPSMTPFLSKLRTEIGKDFPYAHFVEVDGCEFDYPAEYPWFFTGHVPFVNPFKPELHIPKVPTLEDEPYSAYLDWTRDCPGAFACATDLMQSDAIYWFCDFNDPTDDEVIRQVSKKIIDAKAKLYIHTLDKRPPALIAQLAETSGGKVLRKRI